MYSVIKNVIERGEFDLSSLLQKIKRIWVEDEITDEQKEELIASARRRADKHGSVDVVAKLEELDRRIKALEKAGIAQEPADEYPDFTAGKWYYTGDTCTFEGARYTCIAPEGVVCVWSPADYPAYWESVS